MPDTEITVTPAGAPGSSLTLGLVANGYLTLALARVGAGAASRGVVVAQERTAEWASEVTTWVWVSQVTAGNRLVTQRGSSMERILAMEGETVTVRSRPKDPEGNILYRDDIDTALVQVFDTTAPGRSTPVYSENLVLADTLETSLAVDQGWRSDAVGYTFKYELPANILREGGRVYRIEVILRTKTRGPSAIVHEVETSSLWTSRGSLGV